MKLKFLFGLLAVILGIIGCVVVLASADALVIHPKGIIAKQILELIVINIFLMLSIIVPTYILLFAVVYKYCIKQENIIHDPEHKPGPLGELLMWVLPSIVVVVMAFITWNATHQLNPYKPIESDQKPITVQVVAIDWKWLFIYPEQGIATLNSLHIPERTPIHFKLAADHSPMNSFWIPQLSGQIYSMAGMTTQLFLMADGPGKYTGRAVEINGEGYADMTFNATSSTQKEFEDWVAKVKQSPIHLTKDVYNELLQPVVQKDVILYSEVEKDLFHQIVEKYMFPAVRVL
jgi:cytochrome o ubiquinol oxidase subunit II